MKREYIKPFCETVLVQAQSMLAGSGERVSKVGNTPPQSILPNPTYDNYNDPTGSIEGYSGGESLSKNNLAWEDVGYW